MLILLSAGGGVVPRNLPHILVLGQQKHRRGGVVRDQLRMIRGFPAPSALSNAKQCHIPRVLSSNAVSANTNSNWRLAPAEPSPQSYRTTRKRSFPHPTSGD
jgi:hypothetical protein